MGRGSRSYGADGTITIGTSVDTYGINNGLNKISKSWRTLSRLMGGAIGVTGLIQLGKAATDAASDLQEVQNIVDVSFGNMSYKIEEFADTCIDKFGMSELTAKQTAGSFMAMGKAMGLSMTEASDMAIELTALTADMSSFYNISQDYARVGLSAVYTGETETLKRYGIVLTEANLQQYAYTQGISESVRNMSAYEKAMLRYNYIMQATTDIQGDFSRTSGSWANQTRILKEQWTVFLQVLGSGLITVLTPLLTMLNKLMSAVISFARVIGSALVNIFGLDLQSVAQSYNSVADSAGAASSAIDDTADSTSNAADAAKTAAASYDELNIITQDTASGGSGSSGGGGGSTEAGEIVQEGTSMIDQLAEKLSDIDSMFELGRYISDTITTSLEKIDWPSIQTKANSMAKQLAQLFNGLFTPELFSAVGHTIAQALNTAIGAALSFGQEFDFTNLGLSIAAGINRFFKEFDVKQFAQAINTWVQGIYTTIITALANIDWVQVGKSIATFIGNLDIDTIAIVVGAIALKQVGKVLIKSIGEAIFGPAVAGEVAAGLLPKLKEAFTIALSGASTLSEALVAEFGLVATIIGGIVTAVSGAALAIKNFFDLWQNGFNAADEVLMVVGAALTAFAAVILGAPALIAGVVAAIVSLGATIVAYIGPKGWANIGNAIKTFFTKTAPQAIATFATTVKTFFTTDVPQAISNFVETAKTTIGEWVNNVKIFFTTDVPEAINIAIQWFAQLPSQIAYYCGLVIGKLTAWASNVVATVKTEVPKIINAIVTFFTTLPNKIWNKIIQVKNKIITWASNVITTVNTEVPKIINSIVTFFSALPTKIWNKIIQVKNTFTTWKNNVNAHLQTVVPQIIDKVTTYFKTLPSKIFAAIKSKVSDLLSVGDYIWKGIKKGFNNALNNVTTGIASIGSSFINGLKDGLGIASPSKVARDEVGYWVGEGIIEGVSNSLTNDDNKAKLADEAKQLVSGVKQSATVDDDLALGVDIEVDSTELEDFMDDLSDTLDVTDTTIDISANFSDSYDSSLSAWASAGEDFGKIADVITDTFEKSTKQISDLFTNMWSSVLNVSIEATNLMIEGIGTGINTVTSALNGFVSQANSIMASACAITGTEWTNIPYLSNVALQKISIPKLAQGAVIPPNNAFMAVLGDQKSGTNIEAPLSTIQEAVATVLEPYLAQIAQNTEKTANKDLTVRIGDRDIARANKRGAKAMGLTLRTT